MTTGASVNLEAVTRPTLSPEASVAIVSPASAAKPERVQPEGMAALRGLSGTKPVLMAARPESRAACTTPARCRGSAGSDLHAALADPEIDAVSLYTWRLGLGGTPAVLDRMGTADVVRAQPKVFVGLLRSHLIAHVVLAGAVA